jgi:hypothetical protein
VLVPCPVGETWASLREAVSAHPTVTGATFNDPLMRAYFKTDMTFATYGQNLSATVSREEDGSRVVISGVAKRPSFGGRDQARIHKIAADLFADMAARLSDARPAETPNLGDLLLAGVSGRSIKEEISKYALLRERGLISAAEFDDHKRWLLRGW